MKLSEETLKVLKNFAGINPSILIKPGNNISTQAIAGNIVAEADIKEEFPLEFCLYDLVQFLNTLKLFANPVLDFRNADQNFMYICEEDNIDFKVQYTFAKKKHIVYPERKPVMGTPDISFDLDVDTLATVMKASNVMQLPHIMILPDVEGIKIEVSDAKNPSSNKFSINIDGNAPKDKEFKLIFKTEVFKMLPANYHVDIVGNKVSSFESDKVDYYIGLDPNSQF